MAAAVGDVGKPARPRSVAHRLSEPGHHVRPAGRPEFGDGVRCRNGQNRLDQSAIRTGSVVCHAHRDSLGGRNAGIDLRQRRDGRHQPGSADGRGELDDRCLAEADRVVSRVLRREDLRHLRSGRQRFVDDRRESGQSLGTTERVTFRRERDLPYVPTFIAYGELLYLWLDQGSVLCFDPKRDQMLWQERVGGTCYGSPICIDGKIYCIDEGGTCRWSRRVRSSSCWVRRRSAIPAIPRRRWRTAGCTCGRCIG